MAIRVCRQDCKHRSFYFYHYHPLYEPLEQHESQLNHLQPINWKEDALEYGILNLSLKIQYPTSFPSEETDLPLCLPCLPLPNKCDYKWCMTYSGKNAIQTMLSYRPRANYSIVLKVVGGSFKKKKKRSTTLEPYLVIKQRNRKRQKNHSRLPSKSLKG